METYSQEYKNSLFSYSHWKFQFKLELQFQNAETKKNPHSRELKDKFYFTRFHLTNLIPGLILQKIWLTLAFEIDPKAKFFLCNFLPTRFPRFG